MTKIAIAGACGKMGMKIANIALKDTEVEVTSAFEKEGMDKIGTDLGTVLGIEEIGVKVASDFVKASGDIDAVIDFTLPEPTLEHLEKCVQNNLPMVIGTTGFSSEGESKIAEAAKKIPIVFSPNMAIGVNIVFKLLKEASRVLGKSFEIKVDETHHVHKKDSPSGTAKKIASVIKEASGIDAPIEAFREGEVVGNHGIIFDGEYENIEIRHDAKDRDVFAKGAIEAAKFISSKEPGLYDMADVLGLK